MPHKKLVNGSDYHQQIPKMKTLHMREGNGDVIELFESKLPPMEEMVREKVSALEEANRDDAFFMVDLGEIYRKLDAWKQLLPRVQPFYALKCNHDPEVARFLADAGVGFDCASKREIEQILGLGVHPSRIVYANPCKQSSHIKFAQHRNVNLMTFDGVHELIKIKTHHPDARLLLRIQSSKEHSAKHDFNKKFGCNPEHTRELLTHGKNMGLHIVGISFHVGSLPEEIACFASSISEAHDVFEIGKELGFDMSVLDIGGGFPGVDDHDMNFERVASVVNAALEKYFPASGGVRIIAEPGRYLVSSAFTLAVSIIAKRVVTEENPDKSSEFPEELCSPQYNCSEEMAIAESGVTDSMVSSLSTDSEEEQESTVVMYYVNDGIYGAFNNVFTDHAVIWPNLLRNLNSSDNQKVLKPERESIIWGPTCDGLDCVMKECKLPDMDIGQWLYFYNMGAYTISLSCDFNGISRPLRFFMCARQYWDKIYPFPASAKPCQTEPQLDLNPRFDEINRKTSKVSMLSKEDSQDDTQKQHKNMYRLVLFKGNV